MVTTSMPHPWKYDVFVSFRGEDIRKSFMDHLFKDFRQKGIHAFRDDNQFCRGEEISCQLYKAIEESRFLIAIFSKNYASSSWCLRELVKILECKQMGKRKHHVRVIFYDVKPAVVRNQTESYVEAFAKHEYSNKTEVPKWKEALSMAANLSGWDLKDMANGYESKLIDSISKEILEKLCAGPLHLGENLVGVNARVKKMNLQRFVDSRKVHMLGICGISGIGKTTLAKAIYNLMYIYFEERSFCEDIKGATKQHGITQVIMKLINDIMKTGDVKISSNGQGIMVMKQWMASRRILLVLDNVDDHEQLEALAGSHNWFFPGSLIIFTSENKQLLRSHKVDEIYEIPYLLYKEALKLFSLFAFSKKYPTEDFKELADEVVQYVQGHPLALKVMGRLLYEKPLGVWRSELDRLQTYPNADIQQKLRPSFDGLDLDQKGILLDIACSFVGENKDFVASVLDSRNCFAHANIEVLVDKSLITISPHDMSLRMHDLIQRMATEIVREESNRTGKQSRLCIPSDVYDELKENKGTEAVEVLVILQDKCSEKVHIDIKSFSSMKNLRILKISDMEPEDFSQPLALKLQKDYKVNFSGKLEFLSNKLCLLYWHGFPFKFLPSDFYPENIVAIDLSYSQIKQLWIKPKCFGRLKIIKLKYCHNLRSTPDFTEMKNLEELILEGCVNLVHVHPSIGMLKMLVVLNMRNCTSFKSFPSQMELNSLQVLILSGCLKVDKLPEVFGTIKTLVELHVDGTAITEFPYFVFAQPNLQVLSIGRYRGIKSRWWTSIFRPSHFLQKLHQPPSMVLPSLASLRLLTRLYLNNCNISEVSSEIGGLSCLRDLKLNGNTFTSLPTSLSQLPRLHILSLEDCNKLEVLPELPCSILYLEASHCTSLQGLGNLPIGHSDFHQHFYFMGCPRLVEKLKSLISTSLPQGLNNSCQRLDIVISQSGVLQWGTNQSMGNHIKVELPQDWSYNKFMGYETYVVFTPKKSCSSKPSQNQHGYSVRNFDRTFLDDICMPELDAYIMESMIETMGSDVVWLHYSKPKPSWMEAKNFVMFWFRDSPSIEVKECGVRLVCDEDIQEETGSSIFPGLPDGGEFHVTHEWSSTAIDDEPPYKKRRIVWSSK